MANVPNSSLYSILESHPGYSSSFGIPLIYLGTSIPNIGSLVVSAWSRFPETMASIAFSIFLNDIGCETPALFLLHLYYCIINTLNWWARLWFHVALPSDRTTWHMLLDSVVEMTHQSMGWIGITVSWDLSSWLCSLTRSKILLVLVSTLIPGAERLRDQTKAKWSCLGAFRLEGSEHAGDI